MLVHHAVFYACLYPWIIGCTFAICQLTKVDIKKKEGAEYEDVILMQGSGKSTKVPYSS